MKSPKHQRVRRRSLLSMNPRRTVRTTKYWNDASEDIYGYTADEALGKKLWDLIIPPEMVSDVKDAVHRMVTTGNPNPPETLSLQHKDGHTVLVRSSHSVTYDVSGNPELFCVDILLDNRFV
ncbi:MAG: PAS domain-containing protein [Alkalispirochaeta sp.]